MPSLRSVTVALLIAFPSAPSAGQTVSGIRPLNPTPIAPRGGVMLVPLGAQTPGTGWPATMEVILEDGRAAAGIVCWMEAAPAGDDDGGITWTTPPYDVGLRPIAPEDDTSPAALAPLLAVRLPADASGRLTLNGQTLAPIWVDPDLPYTFAGRPGADRPRLEREQRPDRPSANSPFAYWRWTLLARRLELNPPAPAYENDAAGLVAEHYADLWEAALGRLATANVRAAETCLDILTRTNSATKDDPDRDPLASPAFALWASNPTTLTNLLGMLLDTQRPAQDVVDDALAWADRQSPFLGWIEGAGPETLRIAVINRTSTPLVARLHWESLTGGAITLPPLELPAGALTVTEVERPPRDPAAAFGQVGNAPAPVTPRVLTIKARDHTVSLVPPPTGIDARPPGATLPPARPPLTLAELDREQMAPLNPDAQTEVALRKGLEGWEIFVVAHRPLSRSPEEPFDASVFSSPQDIRGVEAVTLFFGSPDEPLTVVTVPERGDAHTWTPAPDGSAPSVFQRSNADHWVARIVLPETWAGATDTLELGATRAHANSSVTHSTPWTSAPWRQDPGRVAIDLSTWN